MTHCWQWLKNVFISSLVIFTNGLAAVTVPSVYQELRQV